MITVACVPSNLPVFLSMCILLGFSVATLFLLPWSMLPDVIDDFALKHPLFKDLGPLFFSGYAFCNKLAGGLSVGLSTMILQRVFPLLLRFTLIVLFSPVPITLLLIGMGIFHTYPVNERKGLQLEEQKYEDLFLHWPESSGCSWGQTMKEQKKRILSVNKL
uniref:Major facilitator superfamily domain containing 2a-like 2 n=1 Tax=Cyprinodon variegatus TaxID=28743 RepID=A0A3Q2D850_CYPVA